MKKLNFNLVLSFLTGIIVLSSILSSCKKNDVDDIDNIDDSVTSVWQQIGGTINGEDAVVKFGWSVSISDDGLTVAIGSPYNSGDFAGSGLVRIFQYKSATWSQLGEDISGEAEGDQSGRSISLSADGSIVAIGSLFNDGNGVGSGHVRVYQNINESWIQIGEDIDGEAEGDYSGESIGLNADGSIVVIGAWRNDGNGTRSGHVRIYQNINGNWIQIGEDIDGEAEEDRSGGSVSLNADGSVVAIGASSNDGNGTGSGHVRVYQNINGTWIQIGEDIDGEAESDHSGSSVSLNTDGYVVAIGAFSNDGSGTSSGHIRVYQNINGTWIQIGEDIDAETSGYFGESISISADGLIVAIGSIYNSEKNAGSVRIFQYKLGTWKQLGEDIVGEAQGWHFGISISLTSDGTKIAIGDYGMDEKNNISSSGGYVKVFQYIGDNK
ncbi:MAG: hypothetical protein K8R67_15630 [Desulfobacteraceae bacterium]|nr:hypothetical protein [Desulfobacteraceae bacterium]